jgi:hypothetical protein
MSSKILVYGGTDLSGESQAFVKSLTKHLLSFENITLVSGGYDHAEGENDKVSVDKAVLAAAEEILKPGELEKRFETWVPGPTLDRKGIQRFRKGVVREIYGTAQSRRFNMVQNVDGIVTISGSGNTRTVLELALAVHKPALPIPYTGNDSEDMWKLYSEDFIRFLKLPPELVARITQPPTDPDNLAAAIAAFMYGAIRKKCLVLMPFAEKHDLFYEQHLRPAIIEAGLFPHRIDKDDQAGHIPELFVAGVETARGIIIDITGMNLNVLYELGYVHAKGMAPFIIYRSEYGKRLPAGTLPFYLTQEMVTAVTDDSEGYQTIRTRLGDFFKAAGDRTSAR